MVVDYRLRLSWVIVGCHAHWDVQHQILHQSPSSPTMLLVNPRIVESQGGGEIYQRGGKYLNIEPNGAGLGECVV
jgi:hypothetical protein